MGMPAPQTRSGWTAEMVRALPDDGNRYEVADGELLVSPSPRHLHQRAVGILWRTLDAFVRGHSVGEACMSPADIEFSPRRMFQPDVFVAPLVAGRIPREWTDISTLLLVVEVLSPSTARADRHVKRRVFQDEGIPEYWIVDADARLIERWRPGDDRPEHCTGTIEWRTGSHGPSLTIDLDAYFAEVHDDSPPAA